MFKYFQQFLLLGALACAPFWASAQTDSLGEPEVTITQQGDQKIEEYRVNGFLYAVKVTPKVGPAYFLVRAEGEGEDFYHSGKPELRIPSWKIFTW